MRTSPRHTGLIVWLLAATLLGCITLFSAPAAAQTASDEAESTEEDADDDTASSAPESEEEYFGKAHRERMYEQSKLSPTKALLYTLAFPGIGNIYAEQYFLAGLAFSLMAFTTMFVLYGLTTQQPQFLHMGLVTGGVAYTGGAVSSYLGVRKYNNRLREGFNFRQVSGASPFDVPRVRTIGVTIRF
ncbi:MAG: hypothetical protein ACQEVA_20220 [Myxococcota bacterium]